MVQDKVDKGLDVARQGMNVVEQLVHQHTGGGHDLKAIDSLTKRQRQGVDFAGMAYTAPKKRRYKMHGYTIDKRSNEKYAIYKKGHKYHIGIRGTVPDNPFDEKGDLRADLSIMRGKIPQIQLDDAQAMIDDIIAKDPSAKGKIRLNSHSLAARLSTELLHANPDLYKDSVSIAPGVSPLGTKEEQEHIRAILQPVRGKDGREKNIIVGRQNDVVWSGASKYMLDKDGGSASNVTVLKAKNTGKSPLDMAENHYLSAFKKSGRKTASERLHKILKENKFTNREIDTHKRRLARTAGEDARHKKVDAIEKRVKELADKKGGSLEPKPKQKHKYISSRGFTKLPPWQKKNVKFRS